MHTAAQAALSGPFGAGRFSSSARSLGRLWQPLARLKRLSPGGRVTAEGDDPFNLDSWVLETLDGSRDAAILSVARHGDILEFSTTDFTGGGLYRLTAVGDLRLEDGSSLRGSSWDFTAVGDRPSVLSVRPVGPTTLRVTFTEEVTGEELFDPCSYNFTGLTAVRVTAVSRSVVDVDVAEVQVPGTLYTLEVGIK